MGSKPAPSLPPSKAFSTRFTGWIYLIQLNLFKSKKLFLRRQKEGNLFCFLRFLKKKDRIYSHAFRMAIGLRVFTPPHPGAVASSALRVPRAGSLLTASSRPRLAAAALAVQLTVPVIRVRRELSPPRRCALPGAQKKRPYPFRVRPFLI